MGVLLPRIKIGTVYSHVLTRQDWQGIVENLKYDRVVVLKVNNVYNIRIDNQLDATIRVY